MPSLSNCLDQASAFIPEAHRASIVSTSNAYRKMGMKEAEADLRAVQEYVQKQHLAMHARLNAVRKAAGEKPVAYTPITFARPLPEILEEDKAAAGVQTQTYTATTSKGEPIRYTMTRQGENISTEPLVDEGYNTALARLIKGGMDEETAVTALANTAKNHFIQQVKPTLKTEKSAASLAARREALRAGRADTTTTAPIEEYSRVKQTLDALEQEDFPQVQSWMQKNLPQVPMERVKYLIQTTDGGYAWGKFSRAGITLYEKAQAGTGYHEAFEAVYGLFLKPQEKLDLLSQTRNRKGSFQNYEGRTLDYSMATDQELKEHLADEFSQYVQQEGKRAEALRDSPAIVRFFKELWQLIKGLFQSKTEKLFTKINRAGFASMPVDMGRADAEEYSRLPFDYQVGHEVQQHVTALMMSYFFGPQARISLTELSDGKAIPLDAFYDRIRDYIVNSYDKLSSLEEGAGNLQAAEKWMGLAENILSNWEEITRVNRQYLKNFRIAEKRKVAEEDRARAAEKITEEEFHEEESPEEAAPAMVVEESRSHREYDRDIFLIDGKENASAAIRLLFATIPRSAFDEREEGTVKNFSTPSRILSTHPIRSSIQGLQFADFAGLFNQALAEAAGQNSLAGIIEKMVKKAGVSPEMAKLLLRLKVDGDGRVNYASLSYDNWRLLLDFFKTMSKQRPQSFVMVNQGGISHLVPGNRYEVMNTLKDRFVRTVKKNKNIFSFDSVKKVYVANQSFLQKVKLNTTQDFIHFTHELGLNTTGATPLLTVGAFNSLSEKQKTSFQNAVRQLYNSLKKQQPIFNTTTKSLQLEGNLNTITSLMVKATSEDAESSFFNIMNERVQSFVLKNPYATFFNHFNLAPSFAALTLKERGLTSAFSTGSVILRPGGEFFNKDGSRTERPIEVGYIDGTKDERGGKQSAKLSLIKRRLQHFNLNLEGWYLPITNGDKKTEWMLSLGSPLSYQSMAAGAEGWNRIYQIFQGYLVSEIAIASQDSENTLAALTPERRGQLRFFHNILKDAPREVHTAIQALIREGAPAQSIREQLESHIPEINRAVKAYIQKETTITREEFSKAGIISQVEGGYFFHGLSEQFLTQHLTEEGHKLSPEQLETTLLYRTASALINSIELHKIFFGDPALMKDATKRIPGASGGVNQSIHDDEVFNHYMGEMVNRVKIKDNASLSLTPQDYGYSSISDEVPIVTVRDNIVQGRGPYAQYRDINETDGQSKMTLPAYREMVIRTGEWTDVQEGRYQWEMAFARNRAETLFNYHYSSPALKSHDEALLNTPAPAATFEVKKPKGFGNNPNSDFIDKVYWKTSVQPLIPSAIQDTVDERNHFKLMREGKKAMAAASAIKVGMRTPFSFYTPEGAFNEAPYQADHVAKLSWKDLGIQVETQFSQGKNKGTLGSQLTKLATVNLLDAGLPDDFQEDQQEDQRRGLWEKLDEGEKRKASPLYREVQQNHEILSALIRSGYHDMLHTLGVKDKGDSFEVAHWDQLVNFLENQARDLDDNTREALQVNETLTGLRTPLEAIPNYTALKAILYALVDKQIASPKVSGGGRVQISSWGTEQGSRGTALMGNDSHKWYTREEPWCEVSLPYWFGDKLRAAYQKLGKPVPSEEELIKRLQDSRVLWGIGFRIPTQEISAAEYFKIKRFLPEVMGNSVIVPSEITKKAGSDFDVDKLNMYLKNITVDEQGNIHMLPAFQSEVEAQQHFQAEYKERFQERIARIQHFDHFRDQLLDVFQALETLPDPISIEAIRKGFNQEQKEFYDQHIDLLQEIVEQAADENKNPSQFIQDQIDRLAEEKGKITAALFSQELGQSYAQKRVRRSLENAYYESLERLISHPKVFDRLLTPNDASELKGIRNQLNQALYTKEEIQDKNIETGAKEKPLAYAYLISPNTQDEIRHNLITGKYGVGIAALAQTNNALVQRTPVVLNPDRAALLSDNKYEAQQRERRLGDGIIRFAHNTFKVGDHTYATLSKAKDKAGKFISQKISQYIDGFVDVAKDTFIMELGVNMRTAGTFLLMERLGNPSQHTAFFMNQPIIRDYLSTLDAMGVSGMFSKEAQKYIVEKWGNTRYAGKEQLPSATHLLENIQHYTTKGRQFSALSKDFIQEQARIFQEFQKYAEMAQDLFHFLQGTSWDTAHMSDPENHLLKEIKSEKADRTLFTPASQVIQGSFIGTMKEHLQRSRNALSSFITLEHPNVRRVLDQVKRQFINEDFLPNEKAYSAIAKRINNSFINYIYQVKGEHGKDLERVLVDHNSSAATLLQEVKKSLPPDSGFSRTLSRFEVVEEGGVRAIQFRRTGSDAYSRNADIAALRSLKEGPGRLPELYHALVEAALLQSGVQLSPTSFTHLIPSEDYGAALSGLMQALPGMDGLERFLNVGAFYRNAWKTDAVRAVSTSAGYSESGQGGIWAANFILPKALANFEKFPRGTLMKLSSFQGEYVRFQPLSTTGSKGAPNAMAYLPELGQFRGKKQEIEKGSTLLQKTYLYQVVRDAQGEPLSYTQGNYTSVIYKAVNAWGSGSLAQEYYESPQKSVLDNNTFKVQREYTNEEITQALRADRVSLSQSALENVNLQKGPC